jgi:hypothetical protein
MNEKPTITISFRIEENRSVRIIETQIPYTGDFENLKQIVMETQLCLYRGWGHENVEQAVKEANIF